jgi:tRNA pseudouridine synthase 10
MDRMQLSTFSVGTMIPAEVQENEDRLRSELRIKGGETMKAQLSRLIAQAIVTETGKRIDRLRPDVTLLVDLGSSIVQAQPRPLFVHGRYSKPRGIPQRMYFCESCNGRGCPVCSGSGYVQSPSVESVVGSKLSRLTGSSKAKFTWIGSEDADSLVLPPGRPFMVELKGPSKRRIPARMNLRTGRGLLRLSRLRVLADRPTRLPAFVIKTRIFIDSPEKVSRDRLGEMRRGMRGVEVQFESNKGRRVGKKIHSMETKIAGGGLLVSEVKMDGGLPIKRFVSGENVSPSMSEFLRTTLRCVRFDILRVWLVGDFLP